MSDHLTTREASDLLGVNIKRVQALVKSGRLPATWDEATRTWQISREDVLNLVRKPVGWQKGVKRKS